MKFKIYILLLYLVTLTVLPTVRALKVQFSNDCHMTCQKTEDSGCDKGKFVMSLNFSPVQFVKEVSIQPTIYLIPLKEKVTIFYRNFLVSKYLSNIWHPPKFLL